MQSVTPICQHLTPSEKSLILAATPGKLNKIIAFELGVTESTVKVFLGRIYRKLKVNGRWGLVKWAQQHGYGDPVPTGTFEILRQTLATCSFTADQYRELLVIICDRCAGEPNAPPLLKAA